MHARTVTCWRELLSSLSNTYLVSHIFQKTSLSLSLSLSLILRVCGHFPVYIELCTLLIIIACICIVIFSPEHEKRAGQQNKVEFTEKHIGLRLQAPTNPSLSVVSYKNADDSLAPSSEPAKKPRITWQVGLYQFFCRTVEFVFLCLFLIMCWWQPVD